MSKYLLSLTMLACASFVWAVEVEPFNEPQHEQVEGFQDFFAQVAPNVYVAGQPNAQALKTMKDRGVTRVINLRTSQEMDNRSVVPYDEAAAVAALGLEYIHIPLGGPDTPYSPEGLAKFASAIEASEGPVLLHCTVAWRASHMWAAYLVAHHGYDVSDAVAVGKKMNMGGYPFAELLDRSVSLEPQE